MGSGCVGMLGLFWFIISPRPLSLNTAHMAAVPLLTVCVMVG